MVTLRLTRLYADANVTLGAFYLDGERLAWTLERHWTQNAKGDSCIPCGTYDLAPTKYNRGGYATYEVLGVPNRTRILIHAANYCKEIRGCIAPGMNLQTHPPAVWSSRKALERLLLRLDRKSGRWRKLIVEDGPGCFTGRA